MFAHGVAAGDVTADSAVLWTRVDALQVVGWTLTGTGTERRGEVRADDGGFVHLAVAGLPAGEQFHYRFELGTAHAGGRFRTIPSTGPVRFAVVSCAKYNSGFFNAYASVARRDDLDFVLHLGDYIYEAAQVPRGRQTPGRDLGREFDPPHDCVTLDDYSRRYAQYRLDPHLRELHERHGMVFTLDDHEIADNAWSGGAEEHREEDGPWADRLRSALTAWEWWQPTLRRPTAGQPLWTRTRLGDAGTLFVCDARTRRDDPFAADGADKSMLGDEQLHELVGDYRRAGGGWFVVGMPSKLLSLTPAFRDPRNLETLRTLKLVGYDADVPFHDRWDSFGHERDRLVRGLTAGPAAPVVLCGDVHFASWSRTTDHDQDLLELVTTSVSSPNLDDKLGRDRGGSSTEERNLVGSLPEMQWCDLDSHGYLVVEVDAERLSCEWWAVETVTEPDPAASCVHRQTWTRPTTGRSPSSLATAESG